MRNDWARALTTLVVWLMVASMMYVALDRAADGMVQGVVAFLLLAGAYVTTQAIWKQSRPAELQAAEKTKRRGKVDLFMQSLDDRELAELRARLIDDTGDEQVSLDELLRQQRQQ